MLVAIVVRRRELRVEDRDREGDRGRKDATVRFRTCSLVRIEYCPSREEDDCGRGVSMTVLWILVGLGTFGVSARAIAWLYQRGGQSDLGFVSRQWLAEHRLSQISEPTR